MFSKFACQLKGAAALTCVAGLLSMSSSAFAAPFSISQAPLDGGNSYPSAVIIGAQSAETFVLSGAGSLQQIDWWGTEVSSTGGFLLRLYDSAAANVVPLFSCGSGSLACVQAPVASPTVLSTFQLPVAQYSVIFASPLSLAAGTYHISITNEEDDWYWLESDAGDGTSLFRTDDSKDWGDDVPNFSFAVSGNYPDNTVPEPKSLVLIGLASLLAAGAGFKSRRQRSQFRRV